MIDFISIGIINWLTCTKQLIAFVICNSQRTVRIQKEENYGFPFNIFLCTLKREVSIEVVKLKRDVSIEVAG